MKIAIIGTAGRHEDACKISWPLYHSMVRKTQETIADIIEPENVTLVSGGAAFSDHIAVTLFLMNFCPALQLYLPAALNCNGRYDDGCWEGRAANYYHDKFTQLAPNRRNTRLGILEAQSRGAIIDIATGTMGMDRFKERNLLVSQSDYMIAFTFGDGDEPKDGGTLHTWKQSNATTKIHIPLNSISLTK